MLKNEKYISISEEDYINLEKRANGGDLESSLRIAELQRELAELKKEKPYVSDNLFGLFVKTTVSFYDSLENNEIVKKYKEDKCFALENQKKSIYKEFLSMNIFEFMKWKKGEKQ